MNGIQGTGLDAARVNAAKIADKRNFLIQFNGTDGTHDLTGTASGAQSRRNDDLSQRVDLDRFFRTLGAVTFRTLLTDYRIINSDIFNFDDFDPSAAAADLAGMKKRAVYLTAAAAGALGKVKGYFRRSNDNHEL